MLFGIVDLCCFIVWFVPLRSISLAKVNECCMQIKPYSWVLMRWIGISDCFIWMIHVKLCVQEPKRSNCTWISQTRTVSWMHMMILTIMNSCRYGFNVYCLDLIYKRTPSKNSFLNEPHQQFDRRGVFYLIAPCILYLLEVSFGLFRSRFSGLWIRI